MSDELLTRTQLLKQLSVSDRTLRRWIQDGAPRRTINGEERWILPEVRAWLLEQAKRGRQRVASQTASASDSVPPELAERIRGARTVTELADLGQELAALGAAGKIAPNRLQALQRMLAEVRQARMADVGSTDAMAEMFLSGEAADVATVFETIISGPRRALIRRLVDRLAELDQDDFPDEILHDPEHVVAKLEELGLDGWGEIIAT